MTFKATGSILQLLIFAHLNLSFATDMFNGARDVFGPYPRIPDKKLLQKELEYAEEFKKFYKAPQEIFLR